MGSVGRDSPSRKFHSFLKKKKPLPLLPGQTSAQDSVLAPLHTAKRPLAHAVQAEAEDDDGNDYDDQDEVRGEPMLRDAAL